MTRLGIACLLASLTLVAATDAPEAARPAAQIHLGDTADGACRGHKHHFVLDRLRDLHICVVYGDLNGLFVQRLQLTGPDGNVYQVLSVPFATPGVAVPSEGVEVDGVMRSVSSAQVTAPHGVSVQVVLPVAGTAITQHGLVGRWSMELSLNGLLLDRLEFVLRDGR